MASPTFESLRADIQKLQRQVAGLTSTAKNTTSPVNPSARDKANQNSSSSDQILDVLWSSVYYYTTDFPSIYQPGTNSNITTSFVFTANTPTVSLFGGGLQIATDLNPTAGDSGAVSKTVSAYGSFSFARPSRFRAQAFFLTTTTQTINILLGDSTADCYGFQISGAAVSGFTTKAGTVKTTNLNTNVTTSSLWKFDARFTPGAGVDFFINDVRKGSITTNLPATANTKFWNLSLTTTDNVQKGFGVYFIDYAQLR